MREEHAFRSKKKSVCCAKNASGFVPHDGKYHHQISMPGHHLQEDRDSCQRNLLRPSATACSLASSLARGVPGLPLALCPQPFFPAAYALAISHAGSFLGSLLPNYKTVHGLKIFFNETAQIMRTNIPRCQQCKWLSMRRPFWKMTAPVVLNAKILS